MLRHHDLCWKRVLDQNFTSFTRQLCVTVDPLFLGCKTTLKSENWPFPEFLRVRVLSGSWDITQDFSPLYAPAVLTRHSLCAIYTPWAHCCLLAYVSEVRIALQLIKRLKTAHGHILFGSVCMFTLQSHVWILYRNMILMYRFLKCLNSKNISSLSIFHMAVLQYLRLNLKWMNYFWSFSWQMALCPWKRKMIWIRIQLDIRERKGLF